MIEIVARMFARGRSPERCSGVAACRRRQARASRAVAPPTAIIRATTITNRSPRAPRAARSTPNARSPGPSAIACEMTISNDGHSLLTERHDQRLDAAST
jgi:hypothetical protein